MTAKCCVVRCVPRGALHTPLCAYPAGALAGARTLAVLPLHASRVHGGRRLARCQALAAVSSVTCGVLRAERCSAHCWSSDPRAAPAAGCRAVARKWSPHRQALTTRCCNCNGASSPARRSESMQSAARRRARGRTAADRPVAAREHDVLQRPERLPLAGMRQQGPDAGV